jgi:hypothetical protein
MSAKEMERKAAVGGGAFVGGLFVGSVLAAPYYAYPYYAYPYAAYPVYSDPVYALRRPTSRRRKCTWLRQSSGRCATSAAATISRSMA